MRFFSALLFFLSLFTIPVTVLSATVPPELKAVFIDQAAKINIWPAADIRVDEFSLNPGSRALSPADTGFIPAPAGFLPGPGRRILELRIFRRGKDVGGIRLSGQVHMMGPVVQLVRTLPRHHLVSGRDIRIGRGEVSLYGPDTITMVSDACGKRLRKGERAGSVLRVRDLLVEPMIKRGERIGIVAEINGIKVRAPGLSRQDGRRGEVVRVKNMMSRRILMARVVDRKTVAALY